MNIISRALFAIALAAGLAPALAQTPPPVPALPDTERRTTYTISGTTCSCAVGFQLFGDSTDVANWIEVWLNGNRVLPTDPNAGWALTSPTGSIATIPRPITDAVLTFTAVQTGTVQIVGARRPRRTSQFQESQPVPTRNFNQVLSDITAMLREDWDKINDVSGRVAMARPGETLALLPALANRQNMGACFDNNGNLTSCVSVSSSTFSAGNGILFSGVNPTTITNNIVAGTGVTISGTNPLTIGLTPISSPSVMANISGSSAAPSGATPKQFNQGGFTGLVKCGSVDAYGGNTFTAAGAPSATQFLVNQISQAILCDGSAWVSAGWYPDNTAAKITNFIGPTFSNVHRAIDVSGQATIGGCSATGVSDETHIGCNDVSAPCHQASVATHCYIFLVAKTTTPATLNDVGLVVSNRIGTNGPSGTVQAIYPYYAPIAWNITTGQTTFAGETFQWYYGIFGSKYTMLGSTTSGAGVLPAVQSGSTASVMTAFAIPSNYTSLNLSEAEFLLTNSGAAGSLCGMTPWSSWSTAVLRWPNNPGLANLGVTTGLMGPAGGQFAYISSVAQCNAYLYRWTDAYPFSSH